MFEDSYITIHGKRKLLLQLLSGVYVWCVVMLCAPYSVIIVAVGLLLMSRTRLMRNISVCVNLTRGKETADLRLDFSFFLPLGIDAAVEPLDSCKAFNFENISPT